MCLLNTNDKEIRILFVGSGEYSIYELAFYNAAKELGLHNSSIFVWNRYIGGDKSFVQDLYYRFQNKFALGSGVNKFNKDLLKKCKENNYNLVFIYSGRLVYPSIIKKICEWGIKVFSYVNDDPFSSYFPKYFWRNYTKSIVYCDMNYVYRKRNIENVIQNGGKIAELLRSYYIDKNNFPCRNNEKLCKVPEVVFIGHYEDDERLDYLEYISKRGIAIGLIKSDFEGKLSGYSNVILLENTRTNYNKILCSTKIPVVFLSGINRDTYTRRCFEIPAAGKILFCPYTDDLAEMFEEDKEIVFYRSKEEFYSKIIYYLEHEVEREEIAKAGRERLILDGHEAKDRVMQIIGSYKNIRDSEEK